MKNYNISLLAGDGTGPEVVTEAVKILEQTQSSYGVNFTFTENDLGGERFLKSQELVNKSIENLSLPTILFHGEEDKIVPIESSLELSKLQNVTYVPIQGSKHELLNQDTRPFVLSELHGWLNQNKLV